VVFAEAQRQVAAVERRLWWRSGRVIAIAAAVTLFVGGAVLLATRPLFPETSAIATIPESPIVPAATTVPVSGVDVGAADEVFDVALAPDGRLWAATAAGVVEWDLTTGSAIVFSEADGLGGRSVFNVAVAADGTVWAAGDWWLAHYDGTWTVVGDDVLPDLPTPIVDLAIGPDGAVWVALGVEGNALIRIDAGGTVTYPLPEAWELTTLGAPSIAVDPTGTVWVSTMQNGVLAFNGEWHHFGVEDGLPSDIVGNIAVAPDGTVWVGGGGMYDPRFCCDPRLFNTPAGGILRYRGGTWTVYTTADGLLADHGSVNVDPSGAVWVVHDALPAPVSEELGIEPPDGISRFDGNDWSVYPRAGGWGAGAVSADGTLWLPSSQGIVEFDGTETTWLVAGPAAVPPVAPPGDLLSLEQVELLTLAGHSEGVSAVAWSPDGTHLATASRAIEGSDGIAKVWDTTTGDEQLSFPLGSFETVDVTMAYSPDGTRLALGGPANAVYDAASGEGLLGELGDRFLAYSPDGTRLAVGGAWGWSAVIDATTGDEQLAQPLCPGPYSWVWDAAWSPDGLRLATTCATRIRVWDAATGGELITIEGDVKVTDVAWGPDGTRIATASHDGTIATIWDADSGYQLVTLAGHNGEHGGIWAVAWSPDGTRIATAGSDGTAKIWDADSGTELATFTGHTDEVTGVAWSPEGARIATASLDGTVKIWQVD